MVYKHVHLSKKINEIEKLRVSDKLMVCFVVIFASLNMGNIVFHTSNFLLGLRGAFRSILMGMIRCPSLETISVHFNRQIKWQAAINVYLFTNYGAIQRNYNLRFTSIFQYRFFCSGRKSLAPYCSRDIGQQVYLGCSMIFSLRRTIVI